MVYDLCDSCRFGEIRVITVHRPLFANSWKTQEVQAISKWCYKQMHFRQKYQTDPKCGYKPKSGQISRWVKQQTLIEEKVKIDE